MSETIHNEIKNIKDAYIAHANADLVSFQKIEDRFIQLIKERDKNHEEIKELLKPMNDLVNIYKTTGTLGKWILFLAGFITAVGGAILIVKQFYPNK